MRNSTTAIKQAPGFLNISITGTDGKWVSSEIGTGFWTDIQIYSDNSLLSPIEKLMKKIGYEVPTKVDKLMQKIGYDK